MTNCKLILQPDCDIVQNCPKLLKSVREKFKIKPEIPVEPETFYYDGVANEHPYVEINGVKWSIMNLGADKPQDPGLYYAWAGVNGSIRINYHWS